MPFKVSMEVYDENVSVLLKISFCLIFQSSPGALQEELDKLSLKVAKEKKGKKKWTPSPWRGSDRVPEDTRRYNYLDNDDEVEKVKKL